MEKVSLQFQTPQDLSNFRKFVKVGITDFNIANLQLTCEGEKEIIAMAITSYGAKIIAVLN